MYTIYVCDVETTGLDPEKNDVIEVCLWRLGDKESKTWWLKPEFPENISDQALHVNKHKREDILWQTKVGKETYRLPNVVIPEIEMWVMEDGNSSEDRIFVGQNPWFDFDFLTYLWRRNNCAETFPFGIYDKRDHSRFRQCFVLDTIQLVRFIDSMTGKKRDFYNLGALQKAFGITKATAHRADGDVKMTKDLFEQIYNALKEAAVEKFSDSY